MTDEMNYNGQSCPLPQPDRGYQCLDNPATPLAMTYIAMQRYENLYDVKKAFCEGTLFKDLNKPFLGQRGILR